MAHLLALLITSRNIPDAQLCDARDSSGLSKDSRDRIRMDVAVRIELNKLEEVRPG